MCLLWHTYARGLFKGNAREVRNFFMHSDKTMEVRKILSTYGNYFILGELLLVGQFPIPSGVRNKVYGGFLMARLGRGDGRNVAELKEKDWLTDRMGVCEIGISQEEEGKCKGWLFIQNSDRWLSRDIIESDAGTFCATFARSFWLGTIQEWEWRNSARVVPTARQATASASQLETSRAVNDQRKKRGMNLDTGEKLKRLHSIRKSKIKNGKVNITWTNACQQAGIDTDTALKHAGQLRVNWDNPNYHAVDSEIAE